MNMEKIQTGNFRKFPENSIIEILHQVLVNVVHTYILQEKFVDEYDPCKVTLSVE